MSKVERVIRAADGRDGVHYAIEWAEELISKAIAAGDVLMVLTRPKRTDDQNRKMWAMLRDVARQRPLVINGERVWGDPEDWKDVFTAALKRETRMAQGLDGGVVMLGMRTSRMRKDQLSELIELIYAYGSEWGVNWSTDALHEPIDNREAA